MSTHPTERPLTPWETGHDHKHAVQAMLDYTRLPALKIVARHDVVFVTVGNVNDDLGQWLGARGGQIRVYRPVEDQDVELWTLYTWTPERSDGSRVPVKVSVPVPVGENVMAEIMAAVVR